MSLPPLPMSCKGRCSAENRCFGEILAETLRLASKYSELRVKLDGTRGIWLESPCLPPKYYHLKVIVDQKCAIRFLPRNPETSKSAKRRIMKELYHHHGELRRHDALKNLSPKRAFLCLDCNAVYVYKGDSQFDQVLQRGFCRGCAYHNILDLCPDCAVYCAYHFKGLCPKKTTESERMKEQNSIQKYFERIALCQPSTSFG